MIAKVIYFWESRGYAWSETLYWMVAGATIQQAMGSAQELAIARLAMNSEEAPLIGIRVQDQSPPQQMLLDLLFGSQLGLPYQPLPPAVPWDSLVCTLRGSPGTKGRPNFLSGLSQLDMDGFGDLTIRKWNNPRTYAALQRYAALLTGSGNVGNSPWVLRHVGNASGPTLAKVNSITVDPTEGTTIYHVSQPIQQNGTIKVVGCKGINVSPLNQVGIPTWLNATTFTLGWPHQWRPPFTYYSRTGSVVSGAVWYDPIQSVVPFAKRWKERRAVVWPMSFALAQGSLTPINPCGYVMDFVRSAYTGQMRVYQGGGLVSASWYRTVGGAAAFPGAHVFGSRDWCDPRDNDGIGEQYPPRGTYYDGVNKGLFSADQFCGSLSAFAFGGVAGIDPPLTIGQFGYSACCGGQLPVGITIQNLDGSVAYINPAVLSFDQASGVRILSQAPANPILDLTPATTTVPGGVSVGSQSILGPKTLVAQSGSEPNLVVGGQSTYFGLIQVVPFDPTTESTPNGWVILEANPEGSDGAGVTWGLLQVVGSNTEGNNALNVRIYNPSVDGTQRGQFRFESGVLGPDIAFEISGSPLIYGLQGTQGEFSFVGGIAVAYNGPSPATIVLGSTPITGGTSGNIIAVGGSGEAEQIALNGSLQLTSATPPPIAGTLGLAALSGTGAPSSTLGAPGSIYFDVSDPDNLQFYFKT
jgi:hypothetical protein